MNYRPVRSYTDRVRAVAVARELHLRMITRSGKMGVQYIIVTSR